MKGRGSDRSVGGLDEWCLLSIPKPCWPLEGGGGGRSWWEWNGGGGSRSRGGKGGG